MSLCYCLGTIEGRWREQKQKQGEHIHSICDVVDVGCETSSRLANKARYVVRCGVVRSGAAQVIGEVGCWLN